MQPVSLLLTPCIMHHTVPFAFRSPVFLALHIVCWDPSRYCGGLLRRMDGGGNEGEPPTQTRRPTVPLPGTVQHLESLVLISGGE